MIKMKDLSATNLRRYHFVNAQGANIEWARNAIKNALNERNKHFGLPIRISCETVKFGGLLSSQQNPCLLIQNTKHPYDYFQYCIIFKFQGNTITLETWYYGTSQLAQKAATGKLSGLGGMVKNAAFGTQDKWKEEQKYYSALNVLIAEVLQ